MSKQSDAVQAANAALQADLAAAKSTKAFGDAVTTWVLTGDPATPPPPPPAGIEGRVNFCMYATSQADKYVTNTAYHAFMQQHWQRMIGWLDSEPTWHPGVWRYDDMLALYCQPADVAPPTHPEWVLRDASGKYLKFYSSVQFLADPGNPAYQDHKAAEVAAFVAKGYKGCHCDDTNLDKVSNPAAINPRTHAVYTLSDWQRDMADLMTKVRTAAKAARVSFELVHNSLWWASGADVDRCIKQADVFELERGFNDPNYSAASIQSVWAFVDKLHSWGVAASHLSEASGQQAAHFNLGCALMCSNGKDYHYGNTGWQPDAWDPVFDKDYGAAVGPRQQTGANTWARTFAKGTVTVDLAAKTAVLP